jgi:hypothetical protein
VRIPDEADQRSGVKPITIPDEADQGSGVKAITFPERSRSVLGFWPEG